MSERRDPGEEAFAAAIQATARTVSAPPALRARLEEARGGSRRRRRRLRAGGTLGALASAAAVAVALVLALGGGGAPSIAEAAGVALRAPEQPPPAVDRSDPRFIDVRVGRVRFPNLGKNYGSGWSAIGQRRDQIGDRDTRTVLYRVEGNRIGYTVVDGKALEFPKGTRWIARGDTPVAVMHQDGASVLVWLRFGQTCLLVSKTAPVEELLDFFGGGS